MRLHCDAVHARTWKNYFSTCRQTIDIEVISVLRSVHVNLHVTGSFGDVSRGRQWKNPGNVAAIEGGRDLCYLPLRTTEGVGKVGGELIVRISFVGRQCGGKFAFPSRH